MIEGAFSGLPEKCFPIKFLRQSSETKEVTQQLSTVSIEGPRIFFEIPIFGGIPITETVVNLFIVSGILLIGSLILTHKMEKIPRKATQILAEKIVTMIDGMVEDTMGRLFEPFAPFILTIFASSLFGSLIGLVGLRSTTQDFNTTLGWALATAFFIHYYGFRLNGFKGYLHSFAEPYPFMAILNGIGIVTTPLSMSLRHFANVLGGGAIMTLIYWAFANASAALKMAVPALQVGVPAILSLYFDIFSGCIQAYIFCTLTMINVSGVAPEE